MKYYVYVTNASYNRLYQFTTLKDAEEFCKDASESFLCYIIKGSKKQFYKRERKQQ